MLFLRLSLEEQRLNLQFYNRSMYLQKKQYSCMYF